MTLLINQFRGMIDNPEEDIQSLNKGQLRIENVLLVAKQ